MTNINRGLFGVLVLLLGISLSAGTALAARERPEMAKEVGDRTPIFSVATSQDTLADYDKDYYGQYHLILTFFPAAFTPV